MKSLASDSDHVDLSILIHMFVDKLINRLVKKDLSLQRNYVDT